jgi:hypothetical protein
LGTRAAGSVYVADSLNNTIRKITPAAPGRFNLRVGVATDSAGNVHVLGTAEKISGEQPDALIRGVLGTARRRQTASAGFLGYAGEGHIGVKE